MLKPIDIQPTFVALTLPFNINTLGQAMFEHCNPLMEGCILVPQIFLYTTELPRCRPGRCDLRSRGVAILFSKLNFKIYESITDDENGNFVILDLSVNDFWFTLTSIYGPNTDQPQFYNNIFGKIDRNGNASYMICGDFNLVIDPKKDYFNYKHINNKKSRDTLLNHISIRDLTDPFRQFNPDKLCYTWKKRNPIQQARPDFFLISPPRNTFMISSSIENSFMSDHSIISTNLQINEFQYSSGLWKHNNAQLTELDYINTINTKIEEIKKQYALPVYDRNHLKEILNSEIQFTVDDQLFLETLLMEIRGKSISYGSYRKKVKNERELEIQSKIKLLEENFSQSNLDEYYLLRNEVQQLQQEKMKGSIIRSRVKWNIGGEKPTRFFAALKNQTLFQKLYKK